MSVSREKLYEEIWAEPMTTVASRYGVSSSYLARVCTRLNVPKPSRGYWAQRDARKEASKPKLPPAQPGDDIEWCREGYARRAPFPPPRPPTGPLPSLHPPGRKPARHELTFGARELFEQGKVTDDGYIQPTKHTLVDAFVTQATIGRALAFLTKLFLALEEHGYRVTLAPSRQQLVRPSVDLRSTSKGPAADYTRSAWSPSRITISNVGTVAIGFMLFELTEKARVHWVDGKYVRVPGRSESVPSVYSYERELPNDRLCLRAFSPYPGTKWFKDWREEKGTKLSDRIDEIVHEVSSAASMIADLVVEAERKAEIARREAEIQHEKWKREEAERQHRQRLQQSREQLLSIIESWGDVRQIEDFFEDAERRVARLPDDEAAPLRERLVRARELIGEADALRGLREWRTPEEQPRPWSMWAPEATD